MHDKETHLLTGAVHGTEDAALDEHWCARHRVALQLLMVPTFCGRATSSFLDLAT